ncbi:alpha-hydroxy-acid oxidizing enzyme [Desulfomarina profundi]|uniref:Alpha-hydroxy-acid oxidizing enzyme n=1 Tax=Desulfomarina profundi TaxID=2772557 RepID=A0A8D5JEU8_9BACT|nr:alpha-hydroxy-acid oxidizing protein [Desulfomarina profundi]BCL62973.1 alpha-hydroxy-acid oxidizing enzyme [Desulfomarina profundi]
MKEIRENARKLMKGFCRVCPVCDGLACRGEVPGMGGLGTGNAFTINLEKLASIHLNMRLIHSVSDPDTSTTFFGTRFALPIFAAPIGGVSFNMGGKISEEEYIDAIISGCKARNIMGCTGDGVPEFIHLTGFNAIKKSAGHGIPFIKPWEDQELYEKLDAAKETGTSIVGMDIDAAGLITLRKMGRPVSPKPLEKLTEIVKKSGLRFILKGIMTPDEALMAIDAGVDGIVVSNHGGRVFDCTPATAQVLPDIAAVTREKTTLLVDGGIRNGSDILKMLALGADGVMIGRPFSIAAIGGLQNGVEKYISILKEELKQAMVLTGTGSITEIGPRLLF